VKELQLVGTKNVGVALSKKGKEITMDTQLAVNEPKNGTIAVNKQEAARVLGISLRTIDRLIALKELPVRRSERRTLISRASLESFFPE
jgi:excisionase family DNA binding protein